LVAGNAIRLVTQLAEILDQRFERARIVDRDQAPRTRVERCLLTCIVRRGAARRPVSRPPTLLASSH